MTSQRSYSGDAASDAELSGSQLQTLCAALGWQGGTYWQVVDEIRRLKSASDTSLTHAYAEGRADEREALYSVLPPSAMDWLTSSEPHCAESSEWQAGWDACRNRVRTLVDAALSSSPSPAREEATTEREEAKKARPPSDAEPWVVADDTGVRVTFSTEDAAWRYRNEYTNRLENPTVTHEAGEDARDAARWRAVASAVSELTLMLHYSRPDQRASIVDAAIATKEQSK
jgi:hypothetical protein